MEKREEILALASGFGLTDLRLFGSVARGDEQVGSDVDFIVRRKPDTDAFLVFEFGDSLAVLLGCDVDVIVEQRNMKERFRETILAEAKAV